MIRFALGWMDPHGHVRTLDDGVGAGWRGDATVPRFEEPARVVCPDGTYGDVAVVFRQLDAAVTRLRAGQAALVRSSVEDERRVPYLALVPERPWLRVYELTFAPPLGQRFPDQPGGDDLYAALAGGPAAPGATLVLAADHDALLAAVAAGLYAALGRAPGCDELRCEQAMSSRGLLAAFRAGRRDFRGLDVLEPTAEAPLRGQRLDGLVVAGGFLAADLTGASLRGADLRANLKTCRFDGADLTDADLRGATLDAATFTGAILDGARFAGASEQGHVFADDERPRDA